MNLKLLISLFVFTFTALSVSKVEAKHHHHSRSNVKIHANIGVVQPSYYVQPTRVVVQQPVIVHTTPVAYSQQHATPTYATSTYMAPTYVVQQPVIVKQPRQQSFFNWGFSIRL